MRSMELNEYDPKINQKLRSLFMKSFAENLVSVVSGVEIKKQWERVAQIGEILDGPRNCLCPVGHPADREDLASEAGRVCDRIRSGARLFPHLLGSAGFRGTPMSCTQISPTDCSMPKSAWSK